MIVKRASTSVIATIFVQNSSLATGAGLTGLTASTSGLAAAFRAQGHAGGFTTFALSAGTLGTWSSGGFVEVDATNAPGVYEVGLPNAALTTGNFADFFLQGAANMSPCPLKVDIVAYDPQDAVRLGLTALPNVAAGANGGLPLGDSSGRVTVGVNADKTGYSLTQTFPANFAALAITGGGGVTAATVSDKTGYSLTQTFPANFAALSIASGTGFVTATNGGGGGLTLDTALSGHTTPGTVGGALACLDANVSSRMAAFTLPTNFSLLAINNAGAVTTNQVFPTIQQITAGVWNEPASSHVTAGTFGQALGFVSTLSIDGDGAVPVNNFDTGLMDKADGVETFTIRQFYEIAGAVLAGVLSGAGTNQLTFKAMGTPGTTRAIVTVDSTGNRLTVTLTP